jgi:hypothetical protein
MFLPTTWSPVDSMQGGSSPSFMLLELVPRLDASGPLDVGPCAATLSVSVSCSSLLGWQGGESLTLTLFVVGIMICPHCGSSDDLLLLWLAPSLTSPCGSTSEHMIVFVSPCPPSRRGASNSSSRVSPFGPCRNLCSSRVGLLLVPAFPPPRWLFGSLLPE